MNIRQFQLEIGKLEEAMDNFLEALLILRMVFSNNHSKVAKCLYYIGLIHETRSEFSDSINVFNQALSIIETNQLVDEDVDSFTLIILYRIGMTYQSRKILRRLEMCLIFYSLKLVRIMMLIYL